MLQGNSLKCPRGSFSFWEKSSCSLLWLGPVLSHSPPLLLGRGLSVPGSQAAQLSKSPQPAPAVSLGLPLCPYSPPCDFRQPGLSQCCSGLVWQRRRPLTWLSPRSPAAGPAHAGLGLQLSWSLRWSQGLFCPEAIPLPSVFSVSSVLLVSYLHKRWAAFGCSLCFSVEWVGVSPRCRGTLTLLPPISPPYSR